MVLVKNVIKFLRELLRALILMAYGIRIPMRFWRVTRGTHRMIIELLGRTYLADSI